MTLIDLIPRFQSNELMESVEAFRCPAPLSVSTEWFRPDEFHRVSMDVFNELCSPTRHVVAAR